MVSAAGIVADVTPKTLRRNFIHKKCGIYVVGAASSREYRIAPS
jgi:hypothetical protein